MTSQRLCSVLTLLLLACLQAAAFTLPSATRKIARSSSLVRLAVTKEKARADELKSADDKKLTAKDDGVLVESATSETQTGDGSKASTVDGRDLFLKLELDLYDAIAFGGRALDTFEDATTHFIRKLEPVAKEVLGAKNIPVPLGKKPRVVIIGTGWGAHATAKIIAHWKYDVIVVSQRNCFVFTPLLAASAVGTIEISSITESIKQANPHVRYVQGTVTNVDPEKRYITVETVSSLGGSADSAVTETVDLDYTTLVYAVGTKTGTFGIPGVKEHCYFLKEVGDASRLRKALLQRFDEASFPGTPPEVRDLLLSFLVIGSGPTGIEFAGELSDLLRNDIPRLFPDLTPHITLKVVSSANTILPMFESVLQAKGLATLAASGVDVILNARVAAVKSSVVELQDGSPIPFGLCFWAGGTSPRSLTKNLIDVLPGQKEAEGAKRGQLTVDNFMRVKGAPAGSILGIGDAVRVEGQRYPTTGQVAAQQGAYVARLLNREYVLSEDEPVATSVANTGPTEWGGLDMASDYLRLRGDLTARPFHFLNLGILAYLGSGAGLAQISGGEKTRLLDASGKVGFWLWRSTYAVKQVSVRNRVCVLIDWVKAKTFGRDFTLPSDRANTEDF